uniref:Uncharacterized protein n=1 Tax=Arundo donax TaxID=35708 RepID=A0A0A9FWL7_ARUDO
MLHIENLFIMHGIFTLSIPKFFYCILLPNPLEP